MLNSAIVRSRCGSRAAATTKMERFEVRSRGGSRAAATTKMERFEFKYYHKALHLGWCSSPRSATEEALAFMLDGCSMSRPLLATK